MRAAGQLPEHGRGLAIVARLAKNLAVHHYGGVGSEDNDVVHRGLIGSAAGLRSLNESLHGRGGFLPSQPRDIRGWRFARTHAFLEIDGECVERIPRGAEKIRPAWR